MPTKRPFASTMRVLVQLAAARMSLRIRAVPCLRLYEAGFGPYSLMEGTGAMVPLRNWSASRGFLVTLSWKLSVGNKGGVCLARPASSLPLEVAMARK